MRLLGSHLSIAGGYYKAIDAAAELGMSCVQLFTKNNNQWAAKPLSDEDIEKFRDAYKTRGLQAACAHASYLINLAAPNDELWRKSIDAMVVEVERASRLGLGGVVVHPGAHTTSTLEEGLERVVTALDEVLKETKGLTAGIWLETTAGQGSSIGCRFEDLAYLLERTNQKGAERLGVCIDTCHIFAAGYPLILPEEYEATMQQFDQLVGVDRVKALHINDSAKPFGSRVDRHAHIGAGHLGLEPFRHVMNDPRWERVPMYLETEKGTSESGEEWDAINLRTLLGLVGKGAVTPRGAVQKSKQAKKAKKG
jgi:deoxyribonuclease IV